MALLKTRRERLENLKAMLLDDELDLTLPETWGMIILNIRYEVAWSRHERICKKMDKLADSLNRNRSVYSFRKKLSKLH